MATFQHRIKSPPLQPMGKAPQLEKDPGGHRLLRRCLLLLLMLSAGGSVLRLTASAPPYSSLKTHISSTKNHLQVHEEKISAESVSCSDLIDGMARPRTTNEGLVCCDRSHQRTDVCYMKGDIRTDARSSSILLHGAGHGNSTVETIRPYTRKWEKGVMETIHEVALRVTPAAGRRNATARCDVRHSVPAVVFSTGGYTGNVYHEFNDGLIPMYITAERFEGEVVLVVLEYHSWWKTKYMGVVERLSNYKLVDFDNDRRVHCFLEMIVGLRIHGELTVDPKLMPSGKGIRHFQSLLGRGFGGDRPVQFQSPRPKLAIFVRNKSRVLQNLKEIIKLCERAGFDVQVLNPKRTTPLSEIYGALNSSDAMLAVHGAAMTHFLFMRPGSVLIQIVPLGLDWPAEAYYGEPARSLGLSYVAYKTAPDESSLYRRYGRRSPVVRDPDAITSKGWSETKRIYLERQDVRVNLRKFGRLMAMVHSHVVDRSSQ